MSGRGWPVGSGLRVGRPGENVGLPGSDSMEQTTRYPTGSWGLPPPTDPRRARKTEFATRKHSYIHPNYHYMHSHNVSQLFETFHFFDFSAPPPTSIISQNFGTPVILCLFIIVSTPGGHISASRILVGKPRQIATPESSTLSI